MLPKKFEQMLNKDQSTVEYLLSLSQNFTYINLDILLSSKQKQATTERKHHSEKKANKKEIHNDHDDLGIDTSIDRRKSLDDDYSN